MGYCEYYGIPFGLLNALNCYFRPVIRDTLSLLKNVKAEKLMIKYVTKVILVKRSSNSHILFFAECQIG